MARISPRWSIVHQPSIHITSASHPRTGSSPDQTYLPIWPPDSPPFSQHPLLLQLTLSCIYHVSIQVRAMLIQPLVSPVGQGLATSPWGRGAEKGAYVVCPGKFGIVGTPIRPWPCPTYRCRFTALNSGLPSLVIIHGRPVPRFGFRMNIN